MKSPSSWWRRFGLHLAAAVGATSIFVAAVAAGAHQQSATVAGTVVVRTPRPLPSPSPRPATSPTTEPARTAANGPAQERSVAGTVQAVDGEGFTMITPLGRAWRVRPAPGALLRLDGKTIQSVGDLQVDDRVVVLGVAEARDHFMAHAVTARRPRS